MRSGSRSLVLKVLKIHPHFRLAAVQILEICSEKVASELIVTPRSLTEVLQGMGVAVFER